MLRLFLSAIIFLAVTTMGRGVTAPPRFIGWVRSISSGDSPVVWPGMFHTYCLQGKYYWEIPDVLLGRDFLITTTVLKAGARVDRSPEERWGYGNDMMQGAVLRFVKQADRLQIMEIFTDRVKDSLTGGVAALYKEKPSAGRYMTLEILRADSVAVLVDVTELLTAGNSILGLGRHGMDLKSGRYVPEYTSIQGGGKPQEDVLLIRSVRAYRQSHSDERYGRGELSVPMIIPWEIGTALCLLPETLLPVRRMDNRVEYFLESFKTYGENRYDEISVAAARRWRLEPRPEDRERYRKGELVEPKKPIVFYIDRNTPAFLVPGCIAAVKAWESAFEKAGYKNAVKAYPEPEGNPFVSPDNPYCSYIFYKLSPRKNASGGVITDPRSGEILSGRISVYHSFLDLVQQWYFNQCAQVDTRIHQAIIPDTSITRLAEFVITHEVGHTLGLCHNFIGSSAYSTDQIRNRDFVAQHGFGASIMDYMRFNHLARPEDKICPDDLIPRVGKYDEFAIEWGYRTYSGKSEKEMLPILKQWVTQQQKKRELRFGGMSDREPENQAEDLSDDVILANTWGIENLKYIARNLESWKKKEPGNDEIWKNRREWTLVQFNSFIDQVTVFIGGISREQQGFVPISRAKQMQAVGFLKAYAFPAAGWLFENEKEQHDFYRHVVSSLMNKCVQLQLNRENFPDAGLAPGELIRELHEAIFPAIGPGKELSAEIKSLQRIYIQSLQRTIDRNVLPSVAVVLYGELRRILEEALRNAEQGDNMLYWKGIVNNIEFWMNHS